MRKPRKTGTKVTTRAKKAVKIGKKRKS